VKAVIRQCAAGDLDALRDISWRTYDQTFRAMNEPAAMDAYLASAFDSERLRMELANPDSAFYFLYVDGELAGYLKVNRAGAQTDLNDPDSLELERIYVDQPFQGRGLGRVLIEKGMEIGRQGGKTSVWLGVWERNARAIRFYEKAGFRKAGTHAFVMGDERQTDFIMRKDLP
jgi:diamine N-acetyltransferase